MAETAPSRPRELWRSLLALWPLAAGLHRTIALIVALGVAASLLEGLSLGVIVTLIYALVGADGGAPPWPLDAATDVGTVGKAWLVAGLAALILVRSAVSGVYVLLTARVSSTVADRTRRMLYANFMQVDYAYVAERGVGSLINALEWEAQFVPTVLDELSAILVSACSIAVYGVYFVVLSWQLAFAAALFAIPVFGTMLLSGRLLRPLSERLLRSFEALSKVTVASLDAMRTLRMHHAQAGYVELQSAASGRIARDQVALALRQGWIRPVRQAGTLLLGGGFVLTMRQYGIGASALLATLAVLFRLQPHLASMEAQVMALFANAAALTNVAEASTASRRLGLPPASQPYDGSFREIVFDRVSFAYPGQDGQSLDAVQFRIRRGSLNVIVGPSGSGKTTIVNLLARLSEPGGGAILVDGRALSRLDRGSWLAHTAFAGQDLDLLDGTILANIALGRPEIGPAQARDALRLAGALGFVERLPHGLDSRVGDRGLRLSGGQRQRIALARALARQPTLLVLDEAANAVDPAMETAIFTAIRADRPALTLIVVTHRGEIAGADQVLVADGGLLRQAGQGVLVS